MWQELPSRSLYLAMKVSAHALLGGDLLGAGLVDDVVVAGGQRVVVAERDLVLAEVALALGATRPCSPAAGHLVADPAQQRLDPEVPRME